MFDNKERGVRGMTWHVMRHYSRAANFKRLTIFAGMINLKWIEKVVGVERLMPD